MHRSSSMDQRLRGRPGTAVVAQASSYHRARWCSTTPSPCAIATPPGSVPLNVPNGARYSLRTSSRFSRRSRCASAAKRSSDPSAAEIREIRREAHRWDLVRLARDPNGALASVRRVVDALHEVERERRPIRACADAGRPAPLGHPCVIAGRLVDDRQRVDRAWRAAIEGDGAARDDPGLLARPDVAASPCTVRGVRAEGFDPGVLIQREVERERTLVLSSPQPGPSRRGARVVHAQPARRELDGAAARQQACAFEQTRRPLGPRPRLPTRPAQQHRPERLSRGADLDDCRARHQLLAEDRDVAPALERTRSAQQRHTSRWNGGEDRRGWQGALGVSRRGLPGSGRDALRRYALAC